jgi:hypothetical protein
MVAALVVALRLGERSARTELETESTPLAAVIDDVNDAGGRRFGGGL